MDDLESLQAKHFERVRRCAERGLRSLIYKEYGRRLGLALRSTKGTPFHNASARMLEARRRIGLKHDEIFGGDLSVEAVFAINTSADADRYLSATDDAAGGTIFGGLRHLQISESAIARVIAESNTRVKKSVRLLRAEEAAERECASEANDSGQAEDLLRQILSKRSRRGVLGRRP